MERTDFIDGEINDEILVTSHSYVLLLELLFMFYIS